MLDKLLTGLSRTEEFQETAGRIYVHMPVDPDATRVFQAHQWRLDALIPGLDDTSQVAAQWSTAPARVVPSVHITKGLVGLSVLVPIIFSDVVLRSFRNLVVGLVLLRCVVGCWRGYFLLSFSDVSSALTYRQ
ncbi:hypothetical protein DCC24_11905 [Auritidibacter sp. NML100628]|nr:hypothetical protein DCC24_11905 [Auritidibacter sp. NML100628]